MLDTSTSPGAGRARRPARRCAPRCRATSSPRELDLAGVDAGADLEPERPNARPPIALAQRTARAGPSNVARKPSPAVSTSRPRKRSSSARTSAWCCSSSSRQRAVAERGRALGRADDVGEQHRRQDAVGLRRRAHPGQELLDLVGERGRIARHEQVVVARELDEPRARDPLGDVAALLDVDVAVADAVQDQRRHAIDRQDVANVDLGCSCAEGRARRRGLAPSRSIARSHRSNRESSRCSARRSSRVDLAPHRSPRSRARRPRALRRRRPRVVVGSAVAWRSCRA